MARELLVKDGPFSVEVEGGMYYVNVDFKSDPLGARTTKNGITLTELEKVEFVIRQAIATQRSKPVLDLPPNGSIR